MSYKQESYIYHGVPSSFVGEKLYPLFQLKELFPQIYEKEIEKYNDHPQRKLLPFKRINPLNCVRGDVLHFSAIHPALVFKALKSVFPESNRSVKFFKIPIMNIDKNSAVLFDMNRPEYEFGKDDPDSVFDLIDPKNYQEIGSIPNEAILFYQEWRDCGEVGAPAWGKIPHVFVLGSLNTAKCEIIDWRDDIA